MACRTPDSSIDLATASHLSLMDARGTRIRVVRGTVWITQERCYDDIILRAGEAWTVEKNGRTIIQAHADTRLCLPPAPRRRWHAWARQRDAALDFLHGMAHGWLSLCPRRALPYY